MNIFTVTFLSLLGWVSTSPSISGYGHDQGYPVPGYDPKIQLLGQHVDLHEIPTKVIRITKTVAIKVPVPYPVKVPHNVPFPVTVNKPYPVPVPQIIKVPQPIPVPVSPSHGWSHDQGISQYSGLGGQLSGDSLSHDIASASQGFGNGHDQGQAVGYGGSQGDSYSAGYGGNQGNSYSAGYGGNQGDGHSTGYSQAAQGYDGAENYEESKAVGNAAQYQPIIVQQSQQAGQYHYSETQNSPTVVEGPRSENKRVTYQTYIQDVPLGQNYPQGGYQ